MTRNRRGRLAVLISLVLVVAGLGTPTASASAARAPSISAHPRSSAATVGQRVAFAVTAGGGALHYQWQSRPHGGSWSSIAGATGSRLGVNATTKLDGREYRVVVKNTRGKVGSRVATLWLVSCRGAASARTALPGCPGSVGTSPLRPTLAKLASDYGGRSQCFTKNDDSALHPCHFPSTGRRSGVPHVALVGDSHARQYLPALIWLVDEGKITLDTYLKGTCGWSTLPTVKGTPGTASQRAFTARCQAWRAKVAKRLVAHPGEYDAVITTSWAGAAADYPSSANTTAEKHAARRDGALKAWRPVLRTGTPVFAIRDNPNPGRALDACLKKAGKHTSRCDVSRKTGLRTYDPLPAAVARSNGKAHLVDLTGRFCTSTKCPAVIGGTIVYRDQSHVTVTYTKTLAPWIWRQIGPFVSP